MGPRISFLPFSPVQCCWISSECVWNLQWTDTAKCKEDCGKIWFKVLWRSALMHCLIPTMCKRKHHMHTFTSEVQCLLLIRHRNTPVQAKASPSRGLLCHSSYKPTEAPRRHFDLGNRVQQVRHLITVLAWSGIGMGVSLSYPISSAVLPFWDYGAVCNKLKMSYCCSVQACLHSEGCSEVNKTGL